MITNLLHDDTMITLENTSAVMKRAETYLEREVTTSDKHTVVLKADASDSNENLGLKAELTELKTAHYNAMKRYRPQTLQQAPPRRWCPHG